MINSIDRFDYTKGYKFSTYSSWWIRQAIERAIADKGRTIRIPVHGYERLRKIYRIINDYYQENQEELLLDAETISDIARAVDASPEYVELLLKQDRILSFDQPISAFADPDDTIKDFIPDYSTGETAMDNLERKDIRNLLDSCGFSERDLLIMKMRFGFLSPKPMTFEEIGKEVGLTPERIRQIQNKCLAKLKVRAKKRNIIY